MSIRPLSDALKNKAEIELNEVPNRVEEDLKHIKDWLEKQPHLKARTDDQWLVGFLRSCKFSLQKVKQKLDMFYTMRTLVPEFFADRDPLLPEVQEFLKRNIALVLTTSHHDDPRYFMIHCKHLDPKFVSFTTTLKMSTMLFDILINDDDNAMIAGEYVVFDMEDLSYMYLSQITPSLLKKAVTCFFTAYPLRPKGICFINTPAIFVSVLNMMKSLLSDKLASRFKISKNSDALYETIPLSILPKEYGGGGDSIAKLGADLKQKMENCRDWFLEDAMYRSDETRRPGKAVTSADVFGVEGSFRKLHID